MAEASGPRETGGPSTSTSGPSFSADMSEEDFLLSSSSYAPSRSASPDDGAGLGPAGGAPFPPLFDWPRSSCATAAAERTSSIAVTDAQKVWRLSQVDIAALIGTPRPGTVHLPLVDVVAKARERFGGSGAAFLDRSRKVSTPKSVSVKTRLAQAKAVVESSAADGINWDEHGSAFRKFIVYGASEAEDPLTTVARLVCGARRDYVKEWLSMYGFPADKIDDCILREWWQVHCWNVHSWSAPWGTVSVYLNAFQEAEAIRRARRRQLELILDGMGLEEGCEARDYIETQLKFAVNYVLWCRAWPEPFRHGTCLNAEQMEREAKSHHRMWRLQRGELVDAGSQAAAEEAAKKRAKARAKAEGKLQAAGWGFLKPSF
ncbi:hypothetical protein Rsub_08150 [Raphidocelis subcapitata]|uniref:Uncharacterized protein n=1 Tax=Raphidocelis subcapitata TaxID=307507 RepID=A0A2V0PCK8_9CHLO|nr:hypothetical protein Rsub_08150 [Raphidocelis subcapitata]|eukprot:GBF94907.1 hypothetical protein Rsub_08150 [Raphidocelis subcapitata]